MLGILKTRSLQNSTIIRNISNKSHVILLVFFLLRLNQNIKSNGSIGRTRFSKKKNNIIGKTPFLINVIIYDIFDSFDLCALMSIADCNHSSWRVFIHLVCSKIYNDKKLYLCFLMSKIDFAIWKFGLCKKSSIYIFVLTGLNCIDNLICFLFFIFHINYIRL